MKEIQAKKIEVVEQLETEQSESNSQESSKNQEAEEKTILPEYEELYKQNSDFYGWIKIDDTVIDYPVMYTPELEDHNFYIHKDWNKEDSKLGTIYIDGRCKEDSQNLIIYGHNIKKQDKMFGSLSKYKEKEYYEQHKFIEFDTLYAKATYEIVAVARAVVYYQDEPKDEYLFYQHTDFNSKEEFDDYMCYMKQNSYFDIDTDAKYGDKLITLTTCDYWTNNARLLVVAKKI